MVTRDAWNERRIAGALLLFGFLLVFPTVIIGAPGMGKNSVWGQTFPFLFATDWVKCWRSAFTVVTLFGLVILESVLFRAGDNIIRQLGMLDFTLFTTGMWLVMDALDTNGERGGANLKATLSCLLLPRLALTVWGSCEPVCTPIWVGMVTILYSTFGMSLRFPE